MEEITREDIYRALSEVIDPEIGINIVDLGLVYHVEITGEKEILVQFTLTSPGCPLEEEIRSNIIDELKDQTSVNKVRAETVWNPPWSSDFMSEEGKFSLGYPI